MNFMQIAISQRSNITIRFAQCGMYAGILSKNIIFSCNWKENSIIRLIVLLSCYVFFFANNTIFEYIKYVPLLEIGLYL